MSAPKVFSDAHVKLMDQLYMRQQLQPQDIVTALNTKFGTTFVVDQVRRAVVQRGWSARRKKNNAKEAALLLSKDSRVVNANVKAHQDIMEGFAKTAKKGADRAGRMLETAATPRDLASAASGFKSLVSTFRLVSGMDNSSNRPLGTPVFNFNFANTIGSAASNTTAAVDVSATEVVESLEDDDDLGEDADETHE